MAPSFGKLAIGQADNDLDLLPVTNGGVVHCRCVVCPCGKIWRQWRKRENVVRIPTSKRRRFPPFGISGQPWRSWSQIRE
ncbi:hypothetical protein T11_1180 [Trichinella zimbabwensis]|uniref:Uncharacterized protein n=1 Tax=Trichinella zimbabwensis TaxID=268475 RepID=A0A0V1H2P2_9BILA|nr:hypothetical protein T11_1180 [Trichinella zimbabwensis]